MKAKKSQSTARRLPVVKLLAAVAFVIVAALLLLPALQSSHRHPPLAYSLTDLKQVALALYWHAERTNGKLPATAVRDADGKPLYSWRVTILPYLDCNSLFSRFAKDEPWDSPHNSELLMHSPFLVSGDLTPDEQATSIVAIVGDTTMWPDQQDVSLKAIPDGAAETILLVAIAETGIKWSEPRDFTVAELLSAIKRKHGPGPHLLSNGGWGSPGVLLVAMADGSVRGFVDLSAEKIEAMLTRAGGESVVLP